MNLSQLLSGRTAFLLDFDGVVTDSETYAFDTVRKLMMEHYGLRIDDGDIFMTIGMDAIGTAGALREKYGVDLPSERFLELLGTYPNYYTEYPGIKPFDGLEEFMSKVKGRGGRLAIVSSTCYDHLEAALDRMGLLKYPDAIISGDRVARRKPAPDPYLDGMRALGSSKEESIAIEDSPIGIEAAGRAGIPVIAFCGSVVVQDVSAADASISSYSEIIPLL